MNYTARASIDIHTHGQIPGQIHHTCVAPQHPFSHGTITPASDAKELPRGIAHPGRCQKLCIGIYSRLPLTPVNLHGSSCSLEQSMHYFFQMQMFENIKYAQTYEKLQEISHIYHY